MLNFPICYSIIKTEVNEMDQIDQTDQIMNQMDQMDEKKQMNQTAEKLKEIHATIFSLMFDVKELDVTGQILSDNFQEMLNLTEQSISLVEMAKNIENIDNQSEQEVERRM